ncbi:MAG: Gfo/Idh/MocA family oxidoreductase [Bacteroidetes bacterium]|nr:Gfo/Idh/MocA family oxidoreductase [Bacteroidota bacterium]
MTELKFALIGCGRIAARHAEQMVKYGTLVAVCDNIKDKADHFASVYNCKAWYSLDEMLQSEKGINFAAVCTPNGLHAEHSIKSLTAGLNVLCEKPLAISKIAALQMMEAAHFYKKKLFVVKSTRYNPSLQALKEMIDQKKLGKLYSFQLNCFWNRPADYYKNTWRGKLSSDGGTLFTQFSHYIDAMLWLFGDVETAAGFRKNWAHQNSIEFEDSGVVSLMMKNGILGGINWSVNAFKKNMEVSLTLLAEKGSIRIGGEYMQTIEYTVTGNNDLSKKENDNPPNDYGFYKGSMSNHDKIYANLVKALEDESHPFSNALDGLKTVETIEMIYKTIPLSWLNQPEV